MQGFAGDTGLPWGRGYSGGKVIRRWMGGEYTVRIYRKSEYIECWKLSTADIACAPTWFGRLMEMGLVDLFEVGGGKCFWAVATDRGRVIAYNGDYVTEDRRVVIRQDVEFGGWEVK